MSKRLPNLPAWQWRGYHHNHRHPANLVLHLIAVPLFILGALLVLSGLFALDLSQIAVGVIALIAMRLRPDRFIARAHAIWCR